MTLRTIGLVILAGLTLAGCAMAPLPPPEATMGNIQALRAGGFAPMRVGAFTPGPGKPTDMDRRVAIRASSQAAPNGSYAKFLGETLEAQLKGAGKLDPASSLVVSGVVTQTHVDSAMPVATAALGARITLTREGKVVFDKDLQVEASWASEFVGAVAIPDAFNHYTGLFPELVAKLLADPDFKAAARQP